jgi:hypothetical protein
VADDLAVEFGDQRQQNHSLLSQPVDQVRFVAASKSGLVHFPDLRPVAGLFFSDELAHSSSFSICRLICKQPALCGGEPRLSE